MQIHLRARVATEQEVRERAVQRAAFVLRRLHSLMPRVQVQVSSVNGPRGGVDKRCQVEVQTNRGERVVVRSVASDWHDAVNTSLTRAAQALTRRWQKGREHRPRTLPPTLV